MRVKMIRCIGVEPEPPTDSEALELWCGNGYSARPVQTHVGEQGCILWTIKDDSVCVRFDDGDERLLFLAEIGPVEL